MSYFNLMERGLFIIKKSKKKKKKPHKWPFDYESFFIDDAIKEALRYRKNKKKK